MRNPRLALLIAALLLPIALLISGPPPPLPEPPSASILRLGPPAVTNVTVAWDYQYVADIGVMPAAGFHVHWRTRDGAYTNGVRITNAWARSVSIPLWPGQSWWFTVSSWGMDDDNQVVYSFSSNEARWTAPVDLVPVLTLAVFTATNPLGPWSPCTNFPQVNLSNPPGAQVFKLGITRSWAEP